MEDNTKIAEYKYIYDPQHKNKPSGNWNRTNSGWSSNQENSFIQKTNINKSKPKLKPTNNK